MSIKSGVQGSYKVTVRRADGTVKSETGWCPNVFTLAGFYTLLSGLSNNNNVGRIRAVAGAGSSTPSETDIRLDAYVGYCGTLLSYDPQSAENFDTSPYFIEQTWVFRSNQGGVVGNITEIGIVNNGTIATPNGDMDLISRALVLDPNGDPTAVTVLEDEYLDVTWRLRYYTAESAGSAVIQVDGVDTPYEFEVIPCGMNNMTGWGWVRTTSGTNNGRLETIYTNTNTGSQSIRWTPDSPDVLPPPSVAELGSWGSTITVSYSKGPLSFGDKSRWFDYSFGLSSATAGVRQLVIPFSMCVFYFGFDKIIPKDSTKVMSLRFGISFDNYSP